VAKEPLAFALALHYQIHDPVINGQIRICVPFFTYLCSLWDRQSDFVYLKLEVIHDVRLSAAEMEIQIRRQSR